MASELTCQIYNLGNYGSQAILAGMRGLSKMVTYQSSGDEEITPLPRISLTWSLRHCDEGSIQELLYFPNVTTETKCSCLNTGFIENVLAEVQKWKRKKFSKDKIRDVSLRNSLVWSYLSPKQFPNQMDEVYVCLYQTTHLFFSTWSFKSIEHKQTHMHTILESLSESCHSITCSKGHLHHMS